MIDLILTTAFLVALTELGDKTQLALLALTMRTRKPHKIFGGMVTAYFIVGILSVGLGKILGDFIHPDLVRILSATTFIAVGIWAYFSDAKTGKKSKILFGRHLHWFSLLRLETKVKSQQQLLQHVMVYYGQSLLDILLGYTQPRLSQFLVETNLRQKFQISF